MLGTMYQWCVTAFSSGLWNIPTPIDQVLDCHVVQTHIKIDALFEQLWLDPGKKSGNMLHLRCHQWTLGAVFLQQDSDVVYLWPGYHLHHDITKHGYSGVVKKSTGKWNGALLSSVLRIGSVCMRVMDVHVYGIDLMNIIFQSAFGYDTQDSWYGRPSVTTHG